MLEPTTRFVDLSAGPEHEVSVFDPTIPRGITVVGTAQAGKTSFSELVADVWQGFDDEAAVLRFSNSNGFRGLTATVLQKAGIELSVPVPREIYEDLLEEYLASHTEGSLQVVLEGLYAEPLEKEVLRNSAVSSVVTVTAEHAVLRPMLELAGSEQLKRVVKGQRHMDGVSEPSLTILDARNQQECLGKFRYAGVRSLGTFVLTCAEDIVARRLLGEGTGETVVIAKIARLQERNKTDRERSIGPMTLPESLEPVFDLAEYTDENPELYEIGAFLAANPKSGLHIDTGLVTFEEERRAVDPLLAGMLSV